jgi:hypothetical protein
MYSVLESSQGALVTAKLEKYSHFQVMLIQAFGRNRLYFERSPRGPIGPLLLFKETSK